MLPRRCRRWPSLRRLLFETRLLNEAGEFPHIPQFSFTHDLSFIFLATAFASVSLAKWSPVFSPTIFTTRVVDSLPGIPRSTGPLRLSATLATASSSPPTGIRNAASFDIVEPIF